MIYITNLSRGRPYYEFVSSKTFVNYKIFVGRLTVMAGQWCHSHRMRACRKLLLLDASLV